MPFKDDYLIPDWPAPASVCAFVSTKANSPNGPPMNSQLDPAYKAERQLWLSSWGEHLLSQWHWSAPTCWATQVHGTEVIPATSPYSTEADAVWTDQLNTPCTVMTADCLPVIFCNHAGTKVAAAHAGWRGLAAGVLENTITAMKEPADQIMAWLGPAISQPCFEVGPEVRAAFLERDPGAEQAFVFADEDRWFADLYRLARQRLAKAGVTEVYGGGLCTFSDGDHFHSYRREKENAGRLLIAIWTVSQP